MPNNKFTKDEITPDTKVQNAATFEIFREDHKLLQEQQVIFAGYKVIIRVQTTNETKPEAMVAKALNDLITEVGYLRTKFIEDLGRAKVLVIPREQKSIVEQGVQQPKSKSGQNCPSIHINDMIGYRIQPV